MTLSLETIRKLHAWRDGSPTSRGDVLNVHITEPEDLLILAFLRMGGESRPWGVAIGTLADGPQFFTVPEARNRELVGDMMVEVGHVLLSHFDHPDYNEVGPTEYRESIRQVWLPGGTHIDMLQNIAAAYARSRWQRADIDSLRAVGNLCNALFIERQRPGQQTVVSATDALRTCYVFPTAQVRQGHLGHLLGWLTPANSRDERLHLAHAAERESVATVLNPDRERDVLQPLVEKWGVAQRANDEREMDVVAQAIHDALVSVLQARWQATATAIEVLGEDDRKPNAGLHDLVQDSNKTLFKSWGERALREAGGEQPYWPNVFSDNNTRVAGREFQKRNAAAQKARHLLVHGDRELQREELAAGHGVIGTVTAVDVKRKLWTVTWTYPELPTLKEADNLAIAGVSSLLLAVVSIDLDAKILELKPKWTREKNVNGQRFFAADDGRWKSHHLVLLDDAAHGLTERKAVTTGKKFGDDDIVNLLGQSARRHAAYDFEGRVVVDTPEEVEVS
jgi:hypothetical protein